MIPIETRSLSKRFGSRNVLDGCDLSVPAGSVTGLLGANGAGKTTLIRCLLGLARPDGGSALTLGEEAWDFSAAAKARLGYVAQTPAHFAWMRVCDLLAYTGTFYPTWDDALARRLTGQWGIEPTARTSRLSPGESQRLALVLALAHRPELLVLDEPAASLDPLGRRQFLAAVLEAAGAGVTVLFSTHLCADLERVADRVAVLRDGRIAVQAGLDELKERVQRLRVTAAVPLPAVLPVAHLLSRRDVADGAVLVVREGAEEAALRLQQEYHAEVAVDALGLEDIAVELLR
jgi:ABC-2 type transport system ATP-binding protein